MSAALAMTQRASWNDYSVGDFVYCLAWIGKRFEIVGKDDKIISLQGHAEFDPFGAQMDIVPASLWMITKEPWDQIWYWPDSAGEHYDAVFERFIAARHVGEVLNAYVHGSAVNPMMRTIVVYPDYAMTFRVEMIDRMNRQINVQPVVGVVANGDPVSALDDTRKVDRWVRSGPALPATIGMQSYRWCVSVGPFILNWQDFQP